MASSFYRMFIREGRKGMSLHGGPLSKWRLPLARVLYRKRLLVGPERIRQRSEWSNWNYDCELYGFGKRLNENFDLKLLRNALNFTDFSHAEFVQEGEALCTNYIKALLNFWYPKLPVQGVNVITDHILSTESLTHIGKNIGIYDLIKLADSDYDQFVTLLTNLTAHFENSDSQPADLPKITIVDADGENMTRLYEDYVSQAAENEPIYKAFRWILKNAQKFPSLKDSTKEKLERIEEDLSNEQSIQSARNNTEKPVVNDEDQDYEDTNPKFPISCKFPIPDEEIRKAVFSVIGALKESSGIKSAHLFVNDFLLTQLIGKDLNEIWVIEHPMNLLLEELKKQRETAKPEARLIWSTGRSSPMAVFIVGLYLDQKFLSKGSGETLDKAEEMATRDALRRLFGLSEDSAPLPYGEKARKFCDAINSQLEKTTPNKKISA